MALVPLFGSSSAFNTSDFTSAVMIRSVDREDSLLVGIDVGGTFTDLVLYNTQTRSFSALKVPSNRDNPDEVIILHGN